MSGASHAQQVLLAQKYDPEKHDPTGWWMSEKLDGVRAYWDGSRFYSRQGNVFPAPEWFKQGLPKYPLDGELWGGRGMFQQTVSIVKNSNKQDQWKFIKYLIFDMPIHPGRYEERLAAMRDVVHCKSVVPVGNRRVKDRADLAAELKRVLDAGGEGLMLREPGSRYQNGRSWSLLKVKVMHDAEAKVVGHAPGKGRHQGRMGGLECVLPNGKTFTVGTGFTDAQRNRPPRIGSVISFRYQELSDAGNPRFPAFMRIREDVTWEDVCRSAAGAPAPVAKVKVGLMDRKHTLLFTSFDAAGAKDAKGAMEAARKAGDEAATISTPSLMRRNTSIAESMATLTSSSSSGMFPTDDPFDADYKPEGQGKGNKKKGGKDNDDDSDGDGDGDGIAARRAQEHHRKRGRDEKDSGDDRDAKRAAGDTRKAWEVLYGDGGATTLPGGDSRPLCRYGARCYRKNKDHLDRFQHPTQPDDATSSSPAKAATTTSETAQASSSSSSSSSSSAAAADTIATRSLDSSTKNTAADSSSIVDAAKGQGATNNDSAGSYVSQLVFMQSNSDPLPPRVVLGRGETLFGRGRFGITSPHVSRRHAIFRFDAETGALHVEPVGLNAVHVSERGADGDWNQVAKGTSHRLFPGDSVSLLPDHSERVKVYVAVAQ